MNIMSHSNTMRLILLCLMLTGLRASDDTPAEGPVAPASVPVKSPNPAVKSKADSYYERGVDDPYTKKFDDVETFARYFMEERADTSRKDVCLDLMRSCFDTDGSVIDPSTISGFHEDPQSARLQFAMWMMDQFKPDIPLDTSKKMEHALRQSRVFGSWLTCCLGLTSLSLAVSCFDEEVACERPVDMSEKPSPGTIIDVPSKVSFSLAVAGAFCCAGLWSEQDALVGKYDGALMNRVEMLETLAQSVFRSNPKIFGEFEPIKHEFGDPDALEDLESWQHVITVGFNEKFLPDPRINTCQWIMGCFWP